jgi:hypothetical protein
MANLSQETKDKILKGLMNHWSGLWELTDFSVQDLAGAIDATDTWIENNQASYNTALPANAQVGLTATQKTILFCAIALARVSEAFLRRVFSEV